MWHEWIYYSAETWVQFGSCITDDGGTHIHCTQQLVSLFMNAFSLFVLSFVICVCMFLFPFVCRLCAVCGWLLQSVIILDNNTSLLLYSVIVPIENCYVLCLIHIIIFNVMLIEYSSIISSFRQINGILSRLRSDIWVYFVVSTEAQLFRFLHFFFIYFSLD